MFTRHSKPTQIITQLLPHSFLENKMAFSLQAMPVELPIPLGHVNETFTNKHYTFPVTFQDVTSCENINVFYLCFQLT